jgi:hypothetical protein
MKLRNKTTGDIVSFIGLCVKNGRYELAVRLSENDKIFKFYYYSIEEFSEKWEDYEEPKEFWFIDPGVSGNVASLEFYSEKTRENIKRLGFDFETREEAEKAVEKLKAWKRLRDKGLEFEGIKEDYTRILQSQEPFRTGKRYLQFNKSEDEEWMRENWKDLDLLFGGEE